MRNQAIYVIIFLYQLEVSKLCYLIYSIPFFLKVVYSMEDMDITILALEVEY